MANTIELADNRVLVQVAPNVAKTVLSIDDELAELGVRVHKVKVACKVAGVVDAVKTAWVAYSILKEAKNQWPNIRKILVHTGLSNAEIITLGLSQYTRKKSSRRKRRDRRP